jgi:ceramide glucosyltransferase
MAAGATMIELSLYVAILAVKAALAWWYINNYPKPRISLELAPVTICQAILSGDPDLENALESTVASLPGASFMWLIDDDDTEAASITARLSQAHRQRDIRIIILPAPAEGINPKLFKLEAARTGVPSGVFLVLDDDTRLTSVSLAALIDALDRSELATGLPFYRDSPNVFGRLLGQFVNNNSALAYLPLVPFVPPVSINGMCYALRVETLSRLQGFEPIMHHLTDDLAVADRVRLSGGRIVQTPFPQEVATTMDSFTRYVSQMHRWYVFALLLMRRQSLKLNILILLLYGLPPVLLVVGLVHSMLWPSWGLCGLLAGALLFRAAVLSLLQRRISGKVRHRILLSLLSEAFQPLHLVHAILVKSIRWRSRYYRVYDNDRFTSA